MNRKIFKSRKMKVMVLLVAGMVAVGAVISHARGPWGGSGFGDRTGGLSRALDLTEEQEKQVRKIVRESEAKRDEVADKYSQSRRAEREEMEKIRESTEASIMSLLNDQQKAKFKEFNDWREEKRERRGCDTPGDCGGPRGGWGKGGFGGSNCGNGPCR